MVHTILLTLCQLSIVVQRGNVEDVSLDNQQTLTKINMHFI